MEISVRMESGTRLDDANKTIAEMEQVIREETGNDLEQLIAMVFFMTKYLAPAQYEALFVSTASYLSAHGL